ncbi:MAG TPA: histidine phosphatase family protein [Pseudogracilibacillus sp.]|nr:histidine phosphatase family protein [Pseudogracilibacillus sp.]
MASNLVISLLRHGLTRANEKKQYIGWTDVPLSEQGKNNLLQDPLKKVDAEVIFSSPLQRCVQTASILFPKGRIELIEELKEIYFGAWEQKTYEELKEEVTYRKWLLNIKEEAIEGGESFAQFERRIARGLSRIEVQCKKQKYNSVAIVTHGGVLRSLMHGWFPEEKDFFDWSVPFGGGYELTWENFYSKGDEKACTLLSVAPTMVKQIG